MRQLKRLVRAMDPRVLERNASRVETLASATKALRQQLRAIREAIADLSTQLGGVQLQMDQLVALRSEELDAVARMDGLEHVLDTDRVSAHLRDAVRRTEIVDDPVPHATISEVLPPDVYRAVVDAIPSGIFFDRPGANWQELLVPPRLAPTYSIATWTFMADVVGQVLGPALVDRFQQVLDRDIRALCPSMSTLTDAGLSLTASQGRIVLRRPGSLHPGRRSRPWDFLTVILHLARPDDGEDYGSRLHRVAIPFRANSLLVALDSTGGHEYSPIPDTAPSGLARYSYEFRMEADKATRRRLLVAMDEATQRAWEALEP